MENFTPVDKNNSFYFVNTKNIHSFANEFVSGK